MSAKCGALVVSIVAVITLIGPWIAPHDPYAIVGLEFEPIGGEFLLGTDNEGRDFFSLMILGTRTTVGAAVVATLMAFLLGCLLSIFASLRGGWLERTLSWAADTIMIVPAFVWVLIPLAAYGRGTAVVIGSCAIIFAAPSIGWPTRLHTMRVPQLRWRGEG